MIFSKKNLRLLRHNRGMLLLEAIMAVVILAISISVIIESLVSGLRATTLTTHYSRALLLADHMMTELLSQRSGEALAPSAGIFPSPDEQYQYELKTQKLLSAPSNGLTQVELTVLWKSGQKQQDLSVVTWLFKPPTKENPAP